MPKKDLIFRLLNLNRVLLWGSVFRGEGSGNEDNFLNSACCAGPRFQAGKVPPLSPASSCFDRPSVFDCTARPTAEKSNVSFGSVASNTVSGTAAITGREDGASGSSVVVSPPGAILSADDGADGGFPGALMVRATLAGAAHSAGACIAQACGGEHFSVPARFFSSVRWRTLCSSRWMWCRRFCLRFWGALPEASGV